MDYFILVLLAVGFLLVAYALGNSRNLSSAKVEIRLLEHKLSSYSGGDRLGDSDLFDVSETAESALIASLRGHLRSMKRAASAKALSAFNTEAGLRAFAGASIDRVSQVRAMSGIVLIFGLIITLVNLQGAVGSLNKVLEEGQSGTSHASVKALDPTALQMGMQGIAASATHAFRYSAVAIGMAAILLIIAAWQASQVQNLNRRLALATADITAIATVEETKASPDQALANLSEAVNQFSELTRVFEETNSGLKELASFGSKFEASSDLISKAVDSLPKQIQSGMVSISADVARGINEDLKHQVDYLKRIAAIYGDQQINIAAIQQYMDKMMEQIQTSATAIRQLEAAPRAIQSLAAAVSKFDASADSLVLNVHKLNEKVDHFSVEQLAAGTAQIQKLSATLESALAELRRMLGNLPGDLGAKLEVSISSLSTELSRVLATDAAKNMSDSTAKILGEIRTIQQTLASSFGNGQAQGPESARIQKQLEHIAAELTRVPKWRL